MKAGASAQPQARLSARGFAVLLREADFLEAIQFCSATLQLNYRAYLDVLWRRIVLAAQSGHRVLVGPFLIDQHISYADRLGTPAFGAQALRAFDNYVIRTCPDTREWRGEPMDALVALLRSADSATTIGRAPPDHGRRARPGRRQYCPPRLSRGAGDDQRAQFDVCDLAGSALGTRRDTLSGPCCSNAVGHVHLRETTRNGSAPARAIAAL